jgi:dipeptidyl-peptidase-4
MKFFSLIVIILVLVFSAKAQNKELDLEAAVLGQWRQFYPRGVNQLSWMKGTDSYSKVSSDNTQLIKVAVQAPLEQVVCTLEELNTATNSKLKRFPSISWQSPSSFSFMHDNTRYLLALGKQKPRPNSRIQAIGNDKLVLVSSRRLPKGDNLDFHPTSAHIAYTKDHNLRIQTKALKTINVTDFNDPNIVSGQAIARYEFGISKGTFWSPDGQILAFYQKDESAVADYPLLDITTTPGTLKSIKYPMAGQKSEKAKVGVFHPKSGALVYLAVEGPQDQYLTNIGWGPDSKYIYVVVVHRAQNHIWLQKYDAFNGQFVATLFEETHPKYVEPEHPVWFLPNNKNEFLWWSERDGFMHLYRYNTKGQLLGQVTQGNWVCLDILGLDATQKNILVKGTDASGLNTTLYAADVSGNKPSKRLVKEEGVHEFSLSSTGQYIIDIYSDIQQAKVTRLINLNGELVEAMHKADNPLADYKVSRPEILTLKADDGTDLHARMIKPVDFDSSKKYPVLVYVYGGPHAQMVKNNWLAGASLWMYHAANKGYLVFTLDNRGSSNRGFEFENCIHRNLSTIEMKDQMVGVEYLKTLDYVDPTKMAVHGWSYGGFMATSMMLKYAEVFQVGVAGGPVTDWSYYEAMYGERYMDTPEENPAGYRKTQLKNYVDQLQGDLLLVHGTVDDVVLMQHNYSLVKAFVEAGILVDFFPYPMHQHNVRGKDRVHLIKKVLHYIDDKLK